MENEMAHELDMSNNRANIAFVGDAPWHGLGQALTPDADVDTWRKEAGLDWEIERSPVLYEPAVKSLYQDVLAVPDRHVLYRSDTRAALSVVSDSYQIVQPATVLEFFRDLVGAAGFTLDTAGSLFGGRKLWALAKVADDFRLRGQDALKGYLLLATSCDGSFATRAQFTSVRVVCNNTLQMARKDGSTPRITVPHSTTFDIASVKRSLGVSEQAWADFTDLADRLSNIKVNQAFAEKWLVETFGDPDKTLEEQPSKRTMVSVWQSITLSPGSQLKSARETAWGLVNGVTHYIDHVRRAKTPAHRLDSAWFGEGAEIKKKAVSVALQLAA